jgi:hypothetical protein
MLKVPWQTLLAIFLDRSTARYTAFACVTFSLIEFDDHHDCASKAPFSAPPVCPCRFLALPLQLDCIFFEH